MILRIVAPAPKLSSIARLAFFDQTKFCNVQKKLIHNLIFLQFRLKKTRIS